MSDRPDDPTPRKRDGHAAERLREFIEGRYQEEIELPEGLPEEPPEPPKKEAPQQHEQDEEPPEQESPPPASTDPR